MYPRSWGDVFYLMKKDILAHPELPNFTIPQIEKIHKLLWKMIREELKDESSPITLPKFLKFIPKKTTTYYDEKGKRIYNSKPVESGQEQQETNESTTK
jgi:hypothetical protein